MNRISTRWVIFHTFIFIPLISYAAPEPPSSINDVVGVGTIDRATNAGGGRVEFNSIKNASSVELRLGKSFTDQNDEGKSFYKGWSVTVSSPLNKSSSKTELVTLDGLANSFAIGVGYSSLSFRRSKKGSAAGIAKRGKIYEEMKKNMLDKKGSTGDIPNNDSCGGGDVYKYLPSRLEEFNNTFLDPQKWQTQWGVGVKVGQESFSYRDPVNFEKDTNNKISPSLKFYYHFLPPNGKTMFGIGAEFQRVYKAAPSKIMCPSGNGIVTCQAGLFSEPTEVDKELLSFEIRRRVANHGVSLKLTYDNISEVSAIDLPIYLIEDKNENLNGGVRIGYRDDQDNVEFGMFIGSSFNIFD